MCRLVLCSLLLLVFSWHVNANCSAGAYFSGIGCKLCPQGTFTPVGGLDACVTCPPNTVALETGATSCNICPPGLTAAGTTSCVPCPEGFISNLNGTCSECPAGTYADQAVNLCLWCKAGQYNPTPRQSQCLDCSPGSKSGESGATQCDLCPIGSIAPSNGSTQCTSCPEFTSTIAPGSTECVGNRDLAQNRSPSEKIQTMNFIFFVLLAFTAIAVSWWVSFRSPSRQQSGHNLNG